MMADCVKLFVTLALYCYFMTVVNGLTSAFVTDLRAKIRTLIDIDAVEQGNPGNLRMLGGLTRLAFHDCVGTKCDGCINKDKPDNAGLETYINRLEQFYADEQLTISRADLWALAGIEAVTYASAGRGPGPRPTPRRPRPTPPTPQMTFKSGRVDCPTTPWTNDSHTFPSAIGDNSHVLDFFSNQFGFNAREATVLLGAHTLGRAHRDASGFRHRWVTRENRFDNAYYRDLIEVNKGWHQVCIGCNRPSTSLWQWENAAEVTPRVMMLNADMGLIKELPGISEQGQVTSCNYTTCADAMSTRSFVDEFAKDNDLWLQEFGAVFTEMINHGNPNLEDIVII